MPYRRTTPRRKAPARAKKPRVSKAVKTYVKTANKNQGETKFHVVTGTLQPLWSTVAWSPTYLVSQGVTNIQRNGAQIEPMMLQLDFNAARGLADSVLRVLVFRWKLDSSVINTSSVFGPEVTFSTSFPSLSPVTYDPPDRKRFEVLLDRKIILDDGKQNVVNRTYKINLRRRKITFSDATALSTRNNGIYIAWISDNPLASAPTVEFTTRATYKDL